MTAEEAKTKMLAWANGERSHWNTMAPWRNESNVPTIIAECARADAATAAMWASVFQALTAAEGKNQ